MAHSVLYSETGLPMLSVNVHLCRDPPILNTPGRLTAYDQWIQFSDQVGTAGDQSLEVQRSAEDGQETARVDGVDDVERHPVRVRWCLGERSQAPNPRDFVEKKIFDEVPTETKMQREYLCVVLRYMFNCYHCHHHHHRHHHHYHHCHQFQLSKVKISACFYSTKIEPSSTVIAM